MKKLIIVVVIVILLLPFAVSWLAGGILQKGVVKGGTWALGSQTELSSASLSLLRGQVQMEKLAIRNPEGFKADSALEVGKIDVKTAVSSLLSDTIEIEYIDIAEPLITLEVSTGGSNFGALMDHLKSRTGGGEAEAKPAADEEGASSKKLRIGRVTITSPKVRLAQSLLLKTEQTISLPTIELTDIGGSGEEASASRDVTLPQLLEEILGTILAAVTKSGLAPPDLQGILDGEVARNAAKFLKNVGGRIGAVGEEVKGAVEGVKDRLGGLLGGDEEGKKDE
ncbi:MAG: hypothetical protein HY812_03490 [Planctomycetes bacterium]|nr:hypothetical protein [Planctomycetota bacterium]